MKQTAVFPDLKGKSVFITGGGSGIGAYITDGLLSQGAKVAFVQRSDATRFADEMEEAHSNRPLAMQCDVTNTAQLKECIQQASTSHGNVSALINNAANDQRHKTLEVDEDFWDRSMAVNLKAYFFACQAVLPSMQEAGAGVILNFSSISYMMGNAGYPTYTTANSAINGMTRSLAREFGPDGIRVNALAPGWILTDKQRDKWATPAALSEHLKRQCLPNELLPEDIIGTVLFLLSNASQMITGQTIVVDGGVVGTG